MAARIKPLSPTKVNEMRNRIRATLLMKKLEDHALGEAEMTASQIKAAEVLLRKCMPDLSAVEHSGEVETRQVRDLTDDELAAIATGSGAGTAETQTGAQEPPSVH